MPADTERCAFPGGWASIIGKHMAEDKNRRCSLFRIRLFIDRKGRSRACSSRALLPV